MCNTQRRFAAVEDQRHDQIFLVVEMTGESFKQGRARVGVAVATPEHRLTAALQSAQQRVRGPGGARHVGMDVVVVALQYIESSRQPVIGRAEDREIMEILDLMVDFSWSSMNCSRGTN